MFRTSTLSGITITTRAGIATVANALIAALAAEIDDGATRQAYMAACRRSHWLGG